MSYVYHYNPTIKERKSKIIRDYLQSANETRLILLFYD